MAETGLPVLTDINLNLYAGEILGIAYVEGNGQTELAEVLSGLRPTVVGEILGLGKRLEGASACAAPPGRHRPYSRRPARQRRRSRRQHRRQPVDRYNHKPFSRAGCCRPVRSGARPTR